MLKNKRLSTFKVKKIISIFCADINATKAALLLGINRNTINHYYKEFRLAICAHQMREFEKIFGEAEIDGSYFGGRRKRGFRGKLKRGRGTLKQPVFGILKRNGHTYTEIVPNCKKATLQAIIKGKIDKTTKVYLANGVVMTDSLQWDMTDISESITAITNFQKAKIFTSTALRTSGALQNAGWLSSTV